MIDHGGEQPEGYILLSHTRAARLRIWDNLEKAYQRATGASPAACWAASRAGLAVDVGIKAFMPGSQADPRPVHNLDSLIGQDIPVKIIKLNRRRGNVVVSRKMAVEEEVNARKAATLEHLAEGAVVTGVVKNLTEYGAFIDLGGIDGLLHVTDHVLRPRGASVGSAARGRRDHGQGAEVRPRQGARVAGHEAAGAGPVGDRGGALSGEQPRDRPGGECHRLRRFRGTGTRRRRADPHQRDDLVAAHEASLEGGASRATRWKPWCSKCIPGTGGFRWA